MDTFVTPPQHINFLTKKLFAHVGELTDGSIAYLEKDGGGPIKPHTHIHDHLFIVISGQDKVLLTDTEVVIHENESFLVTGNTPHSVWNNSDSVTIMVGLSVIKR